MLIQRASATTLAVMAVTGIPVPLQVIHAHQRRHHFAASQRLHGAAAVDQAAQDSSAAQNASPAQAPATQPTTTTTTTAATPTTTTTITTTTTTSATTTAAPPPPAAAGMPAATDQSRTKRRDLVVSVHSAGRRAHAAGDPGVTIVDFSFSPGTITVHVGDSITWTNSGKQPHTATANDHSFDTGILNHGNSASHTFTKAGTFAYICAIHPFMKGKIVVVAAATTTTPKSSASSGGTGSNGTSATATGSAPTTTGSAPASSAGSSNAPANNPTLPVTGLDLTASVLVGLALLGAGLGLRRRAS